MRNALNEMKVQTIDQIDSIKCEEFYARQFPNFVNVYAKVQESIKPIYKMVSYSFTNNLLSTPRVFLDELNEIRDKLIIASSPTEGDI
ncbi:MAG: hypothetical protein K2M43_02690 [Mycoplasmoidaceae bacterium]|nr:hypothetical protein [Mycoplasmoidaceae bacterium]